MKILSYILISVVLLGVFSPVFTHAETNFEKCMATFQNSSVCINIPNGDAQATGATAETGIAGVKAGSDAGWVANYLARGVGYLSLAILSIISLSLALFLIVAPFSGLLLLHDHLS